MIITDDDFTATDAAEIINELSREHRSRRGLPVADVVPTGFTENEGYIERACRGIMRLYGAVAA